MAKARFEGSSEEKWWADFSEALPKEVMREVKEKAKKTELFPRMKDSQRRALRSVKEK